MCLVSNRCIPACQQIFLLRMQTSGNRYGDFSCVASPSTLDWFHH
jgi:hypothetical protein